MLPEYVKNIDFLRGEIYTHAMRLDHSQVAYWIGVAQALGFNVPDNVAKPMIAGSYHAVNLHEWLKAFDAWKGQCVKCQGKGYCLTCAGVMGG